MLNVPTSSTAKLLIGASIDTCATAGSLASSSSASAGTATLNASIEVCSAITCRCLCASARPTSSLRPLAAVTITRTSPAPASALRRATTRSNFSDDFSRALAAPLAVTAHTPAITAIARPAVRIRNQHRVRTERHFM